MAYLLRHNFSWRMRIALHRLGQILLLPVTIVIWVLLVLLWILWYGVFGVYAGTIFGIRSVFQDRRK